MISTQLVILLLAVAALAFYAGYQFGRQAPGSEGIAKERGTPPEETNVSPLPGPRSIDAPRPRSAPPPASAGGDASPRSSSGPPANAGERSAGETRQEPRRTSAPPPARAGLLDPGDHGGKK